MRYYIGVDWADTEHAVWVEDEAGAPIATQTVPHTVEGLSAFGQRLYGWQAQGIACWAAIERPEGRVVDFLLDHKVVVYPVNPKALDRARDRFRMSGTKSDPFDARVLAAFLRTDHPHLRPLPPNSTAAQELKLMTRDAQHLIRQQTRLVNQLTATLKEYYPRALEVLSDLTTPLARAFLTTYPSPEAVAALRKAQWRRFAKAQRLTETRATALWGVLQQPQLPVPAHVVRAKARLVQVLVDELSATVRGVEAYREAIDDFFGTLPAAEWARSLPGGKSGITVPTLWAELGDASDRWQSCAHLQAQAGAVPVTARSGKSAVIRFRFACNSQLRAAMHAFAFISLRQSEWARGYYKQYRARGHRHHAALRALGAKWLKIVFVMWSRHIPYDEQYHLATMARQHLRQAA